MDDDKLHVLNQAIQKIKEVELTLAKEREETKRFKRSSIDDIDLSDDIVTSTLIINIIKGLVSDTRYFDINEISRKQLSFTNIYREIRKTDKFKNIPVELIEKRLKVLGDRAFASLKIPFCNFFHLSCKMEEEHNFTNIIGTYKQFYCPICFIYNCMTHCVKDEKHFDSNESYKMKQYLDTYKSMMATDRHEKNICSEECYLTLDGNKKEQNQVKYEEIAGLYFEKFFMIFNYDPCRISQALKLSNSERGIFQTRKDLISSVNCKSVYFNLLKKDLNTVFSSLNISTKKKMKKKDRIIPFNLYKSITQSLQSKTNQGYIPCLHVGNTQCDKECVCFKRGFCDEYCVCPPDCALRLRGCACDSNCQKACPCFTYNRQCGSRCLKCNDNKPKTCINQDLAKQQFKKVGIGKSDIQGMGLFAMQKINKNELIAEYIGEILDDMELTKRDIINDVDEVTYMFTLTDDDTVDSKFIGNKVRFANHSQHNDNAFAKIVYCKGDYHICLYAKTDINKYDEILFNYDGHGVLKNKYDWIKQKQRPDKFYVNQKRDRDNNIIKK